MEAKDLLRTAQEKTGLSQNKLAGMVGLRQATLSQWAAGKSELSDETYARLAELAGIDPALVIIEKHERKAGVEGRKVWERLRHALVKSGSVLAVAAMPTVHQLPVNGLQIIQTQNAVPEIGIMRRTLEVMLRIIMTWLYSKRPLQVTRGLYEAAVTR